MSEPEPLAIRSAWFNPALTALSARGKGMTALGAHYTVVLIIAMLDYFVALHT
jgi:hypothetical protein